jgi:hypothetical protein
MISRRLKITVRIAGWVLLGLAAFVFVAGNLAFSSEEQTSNEPYVIRHTIVFDKRSVLGAMGGLLLLASSFIVPAKRG